VSAGVGQFGPFAQAYAGGNITYFFTVLGPTSITGIPIDVAFNELVTASVNGDSLYPPYGLTDAYAAVQWDGTSFPEQQAAFYTCTPTYSNFPSQPGSYCDAFSGVLSEPIQVRSYNEVTITAIAVSGGGLSSQDGSPENGGARAFMDPLIYVDPSFPDADLYTIVTSDGIGNSPIATSVPESSSLLLLGTALAGLGICVARKAQR
jgi:hypothetical protein